MRWPISRPYCTAATPEGMSGGHDGPADLVLVMGALAARNAGARQI